MFGRVVVRVQRTLNLVNLITLTHDKDSTWHMLNLTLVGGSEYRVCWGSLVVSWSSSHTLWCQENVPCPPLGAKTGRKPDNVVSFGELKPEQNRVCSTVSDQVPKKWFKAISHTVRYVSQKRAFSTEAQIGLSHRVEEGFFRLNLFLLTIPTGGSGRKTLLFLLNPTVEKLSRNCFSRFFFTDRIAHFTSKHIPTRPHGHALIPGTTPRYHTRHGRWIGYHCCCFSQQVSVAHS